MMAIGGAGEASDPTGPALQGIVAEELALAVPSRAARSGIRLESRVLRLDRTRGASGTRVVCEVSLLVLEMPGGSLRAVLRGRAQFSGSAGADLETQALRRAVRRALRPLSGSLQVLASR
jgi:hypothetical protein